MSINLIVSAPADGVQILEFEVQQASSDAAEKTIWDYFPGSTSAAQIQGEPEQASPSSDVEAS